MLNLGHKLGKSREVINSQNRLNQNTPPGGAYWCFGPQSEILIVRKSWSLIGCGNPIESFYLTGTWEALILYRFETKCQCFFSKLSTFFPHPQDLTDITKNSGFTLLVGKLNHCPLTLRVVLALYPQKG